jgi:hypothetical protein
MTGNATPAHASLDHPRPESPSDNRDVCDCNRDNEFVEKGSASTAASLRPRAPEMRLLARSCLLSRPVENCAGFAG